MPDLLAGTTILAQDWPPAVFVTDATDETGVTNTSFEPGTTPVGVVFTAPTSGRAEVTWYARGESNSAGIWMAVSAAVRTGGTIGSGTAEVTANDVRALFYGTDRDGKDMSYTVENLVPGDTYNAQIEFRMTGAGNGDIFDRQIGVKPLS